MFWKFDLHTTSHIDTLLEREDVTLFELMEEEDILQECKANNRKLVEFLTRPHNMEALVTCITQEPSEDMDEKVRYKYPNISCEILTADVMHVNDALGEDEGLLSRLYGFLQNDSTLNPLLASFFSKVMGILINRKSEQIVDFLRKKDDFVALLLKHIGTSAIMDLLLRLLTCVEQPQLRQDVLNWLNEEKIIQRLIEMIRSSRDEDQHSNASQSLCDIIRLSREQMIQIQDSPEPDQLLATLEKQETIEQLLSNMFEDGERDESVIVNGIQVLLTLLETRRPRTGTLQAIKSRLQDFHQLLLEPPKKSKIVTTWGFLDPPLGNTRVHVVKLVTSMLQVNNSEVNQELMQLNTLDTLLDLYFKYVWNNFLHLQVELCIGTALGNPPIEESAETPAENNAETVRENPLIKHLFQKCQLIHRVVSAWEENDKEQLEGGRRKGYMGHLTRIANAMVQNSENGPNHSLIAQLIKELPDEARERWDKFVLGSLSDTNKKNTVDLVSFWIGLGCVSAFERAANISFVFDANSDGPNTNLFEECWKEKIRQFNDEEGSDEEDVWQEKELRFATNAPRTPRSVSSGSTDSEGSRDSEEEEEEEGTLRPVKPGDDKVEMELNKGECSALHLPPSPTAPRLHLLTPTPSSGANPRCPAPWDILLTCECHLSLLLK
uniref:Protein phosphatase 6 regulatory subunit 1 n=1 Tax=Callorhinchus milii TaxID=7868 RepID=A0A4W3JQT9_CALMI